MDAPTQDITEGTVCKSGCVVSVETFTDECITEHVQSHGPLGELYVDRKAGDVGFIIDTAGCSQAKKGPLEARSSSPTGS